MYCAPKLGGKPPTPPGPKSCARISATICASSAAVTHARPSKKSREHMKYCPLRPFRGEREGTRRLSDGEGEVGAGGLETLTSPCPLRPPGAEREKSLWACLKIRGRSIGYSEIPRGFPPGVEEAGGAA